MQATIENQAPIERAKVVSLFGSRSIATLFRRAMAIDDEPENEERAMALYREVVRLDEKHAAAWNNLGVMHFHRRELPEALHAWGMALKAEPYRAESLSNLGALWEYEGKLRLAIDMYIRAIDCDGDLEDARVNLAALYEEVGCPQNARRHWEIYIDRHPQGRYVDVAWGKVSGLT